MGRACPPPTAPAAPPIRPAARLLRLKEIFPGANSGKLAMRQPELVLGFDMDRLDAIAEELRLLLPNLNTGEREGRGDTAGWRRRGGVLRVCCADSNLHLRFSRMPPTLFFCSNTRPACRREPRHARRAWPACRNRRGGAHHAKRRRAGKAWGGRGRRACSNASRCSSGR